MKKFVAVILAILYLGSSAGATVHLHYCMGQLAEWGLGHRDSTTCSKCGMEKADSDKGCCKDEHKFIKNSHDQKINENGFPLNLSLSQEAPHEFPGLEPVQIPSVIRTRAAANDPPSAGNTAVHILHCHFRI